MQATPTAAALNADRQMQPHMLVRRSIALVLAGGRGSRLKQLTDRRAKPAVYFGGKFRIVDFALSNCMNSGIRRIGVITQYKSHSLLRHLQRGWAFLKTEMNEFVDLLPAQQRVDEESWYRGTADAVYQNQDILAAYGADYIVVLAGDHIYKMNYALMLADHVALGAEVTMITTSPGSISRTNSAWIRSNACPLTCPAARSAAARPKAAKRRQLSGQSLPDASP